MVTKKIREYFDTDVRIFLLGERQRKERGDDHVIVRDNRNRSR